nr:hypothetical protein [uncultured Draconibacterium sp.]
MDSTKSGLTQTTYLLLESNELPGLIGGTKFNQIITAASLVFNFMFLSSFFFDKQLT